MTGPLGKIYISSKNLISYWKYRSVEYCKNTNKHSILILTKEDKNTTFHLGFPDKENLPKSLFAYISDYSRGLLKLMSGFWGEKGKKQDQDRHDPVQECHDPVQDCHDPVPDCHLPVPDCHDPVPDCHDPVPDCHDPVPDCHLPVPDCHLPVPDCHDPVPDCHDPVQECHDSRQEIPASNQEYHTPDQQNYRSPLKGHFNKQEKDGISLVISLSIQKCHFLILNYCITGCYSLFWHFSNAKP